MRRTLLALSAALLLLAACGGGGGGSAASTSPTTSAGSSSSAGPASSSSTTAASTTTSSTNPCPRRPGASLDPLSDGQPSSTMQLTAVDLSGGRCVDTVTFRFDSQAPQPPGYTVKYEAGPFVQAGSGKPVAVPGSSFLVVRLDPATEFDFAAGKPSYSGSTRITATGTHAVAALVESGSYEGVVTWVIGLRSQQPFTVDATGAPDHSLVVVVG